MKTHMAIAALAATLVVPAVWGQAGSASHVDPAAPMKVGALNMEAAITSTQEGKQAAN